MLIEQRPSGGTRIKHVLRLRCPNCGSAKVFYKAKYPGARPQMKQVCEHCGYQFNRDEAYFKGAVYLSYGLSIIEGVLAFLLAKLFIFGLSDRDLILIAIGTMLFLGIYNYKIARVWWLSRSGEQT
jgi:uncharacterized protein (DUF983 family)